MGRISQDAIRLRAMLDYNGKSQEEVAALLGISRGMITQWTTGRVTFSGAVASITLKRLLDAGLKEPPVLDPAPEVRLAPTNGIMAELQSLKAQVQQLQAQGNQSAH
jgi:transcriptional regulator with XRE-family HTH domain